MKYKLTLFNLIIAGYFLTLIAIIISVLIKSGGSEGLTALGLLTLWYLPFLLVILLIDYIIQGLVAMYYRVLLIEVSLLVLLFICFQFYS